MAALQTSWILLMILIGVAGTIAAYLASRLLRRGSAEAGEGPEPERGPIPAVLWVLYGSVAVGMIGYVVWAWLVRPNY